MNLQNHTSALPDHLYGPTVEGGLVQWPPTLTSALRGCLGIVAFVGIVSEIITMRRISSFMSFSSKPHPESTSTVRASRRPKDVDLEQHPQLLFSFSICDVLQCGLCAPLIIFRKLSDFDMAWSWSDAIFRTIGSSHLLVVIFKIRQKLVRMAEHTDKQTNTDTNNSSDHRQNQLVESSKFEGVLEVFVLWLVSIFVISMIFMLCQALKYFASFENSDKILLLGVLILAHFTPLLLLSFHGFKVRALRNRVIKSASERRQSSFSRHQHQNVQRDLSRLSDDSCTLMTTTAGKNNTNFSTLSLAGSFTKRQRRSSWNSFRKKSGSSRNKNQSGEKMSPKLDRHPSLKYSIKRRRTSSLADLNDYNKGRQIEEIPKPIDDQTRQHHHHHQQQNDDQFKSSQFLTVSLKRNNSNRSQKTKSFDRSDTDNQPRTKTRRRRLMMMTTSPKTSASSGNESGKSSRSSSRSDRSSSSGRLERHPSLRFSTRNKTLRNQEVLDGWRKQASDEECGKAKRRRRKFFRETGGSHEVLHKSFKTDKERSSERYPERHKFGGSMRMTEGKKISRKIGPRNALMSRSHSHADHKKLTTLDRHPSLKFRTQKISIRSSTSKQILAEENMKGSTNKFDHSSKNHLLLDGHGRYPASFGSGSKSQKFTGTCGMTEDHKMASLSQSHSYSTLRPDDQQLGRTSSCRGSFVRRTNDHHHHHHHHQHHHHSSFRIPNSISNLHSNEMTFIPDDVTAPHLLPEKEACHSRTSQAIEDSSWRGKRNVCFPPLEGVIMSTLLLNLPVAMFFVLVFFIFNPSESPESPLVAHKLFSVCVSYAATTVRACIIFRSLS